MSDTVLIEDEYAQGLERLSQDMPAAITELLVGHKITKVTDDHLLLDDGTLLRVVANQGGCSCSAGDYDLTELNGVDNIITAVEFANDPAGDEHADEASGTYKVFVYADNVKVNLLTVTGSDGNGWYGTGYAIYVRRPS